MGHGAVPLAGSWDQRGHPLFGPRQPSQQAGDQTPTLAQGQNGVGAIAFIMDTCFEQALCTGPCTDHTSSPQGVCGRKRRDEAKPPSSPMTPSPGEGGQGAGFELFLEDWGWGGAMEAKGRRQEGLQAQQKKQSIQGLVKLGLAAQSSHVGEKIKGRLGVKLPFPRGETAVPGATVALAAQMGKGELSSHCPHLLLLGQPWAPWSSWSCWKRWSQRCSRRQWPPRPSW